MDSPLSPLSYQPYLDQLIAFGSVESRKADLLEAKAEYFRLTGEVFEDDKLFELRMASFLDYYLYDRVSPGTGKTPAVEFYEQRLANTSPEESNAFRSFTETVHGIFEVRKLGKGLVRLRDMYSGKDFDVTERRNIAGLETGDILEARLIPFGGHLLFTSSFCYHPRAAVKSIKAEVKRRKKKEPERTPNELVWECARRALNMERYRQLAVEKIYDFEQKVL
ncbi:hypothetical protein HUA74_16825 [Myxococcus sp. CA051A]|uniref:Uncharacterized protein n=1 Tax=Myxococcus llanfairpwllgwyngyllgogerychwyrndrobwllllantysiliogogogochensis TaxID=2590453 RepID=A0A540WS27_9BACT|nr:MULTISPECIES: hypothetical protein [Myxococcus]NTX06987.1 hypothetical protein [Myxococcus sp. CA040A]NTX13701.1 hypothetical protein [Myxococcus sp. CA056]NTX38617.1 hypothetical protein [Myxococcus sp. CA033]NTX54494.1 hypothetical protein [Myxococcus sp. CA039A]NTX62320.1 hypothetical protein [Myxococcus sp. CA051A]